MSEMTPETLRAIAFSLRNRPLMFPTRRMKLTGHYLDQHSVGVDAAADAWEADRKQLEEAERSIRDAMNNLGVPGPGYPAPVAEAYRILSAALAKEKP